jgi:hypothetical protein
MFLNLEAARLTFATSLFELATLAANIRLLVLVGTHAKVLDGFTSVDGTTEKDGVGSSGSTKSKLIKGEDFTAGLKDASLGSLGETKGSDGELGNLQHARIVSDGTNNDNSLTLLGLGVANNAGDRDGRSVDAGHKETLKDDLVEVGVGTASKEAVQLVS